MTTPISSTRSPFAAAATDALSNAPATPPLGAAQPTEGGYIPDNPKSKLGKDEFLKLLVAQMKNQDPMNPQDGTQMATQLAQFSNVEQLVTANETLDNIRSLLLVAQMGTKSSPQTKEPSGTTGSQSGTSGSQETQPTVT